jgi:hypothetical protein
VTHSTTTWGWSNEDRVVAWPVQVYEFEFVDREAAVRRLTFYDDETHGSDGGLYFNSEAFRKSLGREEYSDGRSTFEVRIVYLAADPRHLALADPRFRPVEPGSPVSEVLEGLFECILPLLLLEYWVFAASVRVATAILPDASARLIPLETAFFTHWQNDWSELRWAIKKVDPEAALLDGDLRKHEHIIEGARVLVLPVPYESRFSTADIGLVKRWVDNGGGLLLMGYYAAARRQGTTVSDMARAFGYEFADDLLMPRGSACQDAWCWKPLSPQVVSDPTGAVKVRVRSEHEIARGVRELAVLSSSTILAAGSPSPVFRLETGDSASTWVPRYLSGPRGPGEATIATYTEAGRGSAPVAVAFEAGHGRVMITGTWTLFTVDYGDNGRFVRNILEWLATQHVPR